jgi:hypothetical protein
MTKININKDKIKFVNLHKSFFSDIENTSCKILNDRVVIYENSQENPDPASVELEVREDIYFLNYWDGYSLADRFSVKNYEEALMQFKKLSKKLAKNLRRF